MLRESRERFFVGSPATVRQKITALAERAGTREIMVTSMIHDHADRRRSYELLAEAFDLQPMLASGRAAQLDRGRRQTGSGFLWRVPGRVYEFHLQRKTRLS